MPFVIDSNVLVTHDLRGFSSVAGLRVLDPLPSPDDVPTPSTAREGRVRYRASSSRSGAPPSQSSGRAAPPARAKSGRGAA